MEVKPCIIEIKSIVCVILSLEPLGEWAPEENKQPLLRLFVNEGRRPLNERTSVSEVIEFSGRVTEASACA